MAYINRTIELHFESDRLVFDGANPQMKEQYEAFLRALGYMVWYGMSRETVDTTAKGGINVGKSGMDDVEICCTYRDANAPREARGFTMAAIAREGGTTYSTHS